jgi:hypothetical protein
LPRPERPFLERLATTVGRETDDPEVPVILGPRILVVHLEPSDSDVTVDRDELRADREPLVGPSAFPVPHLRDRGQADDMAPAADPRSAPYSTCIVAENLRASEHL